MPPDLTHALHRRQAETARRVAMMRGMGVDTKRTRIPKARPPALIESDYATWLIGVVDHAHVQLEPLLVELPRLVTSAAHDLGRLDRRDAGEARRAQEMIEAARERMAAATQRVVVVPMISRIATRASVHQHDQLDRQVRAALGVPLWLPRTVPITVRMDSMRFDAVDSITADFITHNVSLIKSLGDQALVQVEKMITGAFARGDRHETLAKEIERRFDVARSSARLIAVDQLGKLTAQLTRERQKSIGIKRWRWQTMGDEAVRDTHVVLGARDIAYNYDGTGPQPPFMPGQEPRCRCNHDPEFSDVMARLKALEAGLADDEIDALEQAVG